MKVNKYYEFQAQLSLPFLSTSPDALDQIFNTLTKHFDLQKNSTQRFIDLGAGDGNIIIYSALNYNISSVGIEINSNLINEIKDRIRILKESKKYEKKILRKIKIKKGDLFQQDLRKYDFVYLFSLPTMQKFLKHVFITAKVGTIFISYKYPLNNFDLFFKLEYVLDTNIKNDLIQTYFYRKLKS